jgi:phage shock protein C
MSGRRRFYRDPSRGYIAGVCVGIADYFGWNVKIIRVVAVLALIFGGAAPVIVAYLVLWYLMDPAPSDHSVPLRSEANGNGAESRSAPYRASMTDLKSRFARLDERLRHIEECVTSNELELRRELRKLES